MDKFLVSIGLAIGLALAAPDIGASDGPLHMGVVTDLAIALLFFLHGASLSRDTLVSAAGNWKLHLLIQSTTFVLFPLIGFALYFGATHLLSEPLRLGFFFLCAISSTISSSVAMTAMAKGNVPAAVFNATLSGLIGMVVTPMLIAFVSPAGDFGNAVATQMQSIFLKLLAPFVLGQLLSSALMAVLKRHKRAVGIADRAVILMIVYVAFCNATAAGLWAQFGIQHLLQIMVLVGGLLAVALVVIIQVCHALGFAQPERAAAVFCGATKSLANGAPIAKVIFGASPTLTIILLPLLFYHQLQLVVCGALASRYAAASERTDARAATALS